MAQFATQWHRPMSDFTFPKGMPADMQRRVIARRRQIMVQCYLNNGIGEECMSATMLMRVCQELEQLHAAWGDKFGFYDEVFEGFDVTKEDKLITNNGKDSGVVNAAMQILIAKKARERAEAMPL